MAKRKGEREREGPPYPRGGWGRREGSCLLLNVSTILLCLPRALVKRHDLLEKKVERAEGVLSAKAEAKETIQREV